MQNVRFDMMPLLEHGHFLFGCMPLEFSFDGAIARRPRGETHHFGDCVTAAIERMLYLTSEMVSTFTEL